MKSSIKDFFSQCDQIRRTLQILSHLLKKSLTKNFFFFAALPNKCTLINVSKIVLYVLKVVLGSLSLFTRRSWYFNLYNLGKNIWMFFYVMVQFHFTASETELDHCHQRVDV